MADLERFEVRLFVADGPEDQDDCRYTIEQWFFERPGIETVAGLFDEAKRDFAKLYPETEAANFSVEVTRLRPYEQFDMRAAQND